MNVNTLKVIAISIAAIYTTVTILFSVLANNLLFQPPPSSYRDNETIIKLHTYDNEHLSAVYLTNPKAHYTILYSHGNAEDLAMIYPWLVELQHHGFAVFAYDYPGYGTSTGAANEQSVYFAIVAAYNYLIDHYKLLPQQIIVMGRSVGAGATIHLAANEPVGGVIIESAFTSAYSTITKIPLLPFDKFRNLSKIKDIREPIMVIHGTEDNLVPFYQGQMLYEAAHAPKVYYWVENAEHNNIREVAGNNYWQALAHFITVVNKFHHFAL